MRRRDFITLIGGTAASWPLAARAQQATMLVIGFLDSRLPDAVADRLRGFRQGLKDTGYVEGENAAIVYRFAENQGDRLPALAAELVSRHVAVIVTGGLPSTFAAKAATTTIPVVFLVGEDPVRLGIVTSFSRPDGNITGINDFTNELAGKRLELLRELVPQAARVAVLVNGCSCHRTANSDPQRQLTASESLRDETRKDFRNKIGTTRTRANSAVCPQLVEADIEIPHCSKTLT
jgi:putative ABC transport system substrate-binding protein